MIGITALAVAGLRLPYKFLEFGTVELCLSRLSSKVFANVALDTIALSRPKEEHAASIKAASIVLKSFLKLSLILALSALYELGSHAILNT